jgi:hypothetical protein
MEYAFWNTLHDGSVNAVEGTIPGDITLSVGIEYLCAMLPTTAASLRVSLLRCHVFSYKPYGEDAVSDLCEIASLEIEILSAVPHDGWIEVCCAGGTLKAAYQTVEIRLIEGQLVSQTDLEVAADRYWSEWEKRNRKYVLR